MYVFRNYTIENLFEADTVFSGYDDISEIPEDNTYVWFYNCPVGFEPARIADEVRGIGEKLRIVAGLIPPSATFYVVSIENMFPTGICSMDREVADALAEVNRLAFELAQSTPNIKYVDFGSFLSRYEPSDWVAWRFYFISQMIVNPKLVPAFKEWWGAQVRTIGGCRKKCLVLDLDNTLWGGVLGEDGIAGIKMAGDYPGNAFHYFQCALKALSETGVILAVCSKNNESDVLELWEKNPFVVLGPKYISAYRINWNNKADNIRELANELNIGLDSMVFVDDNPTERELVRGELPMVEVPDFPAKPYQLMEFYAELVERYFRAYSLTREDLAKTEQYKANARRSAEQAHFTNLDDFIKSLEIEIDIVAADDFNIDRLAQMTQKTNQFNLTTKRYSVADLNGLVEDGARIFAISVRDKFGDNGITGEIIVTGKGDEATIDTLLLSCRILGKKIENAFIDAVLCRLRAEGVKVVKAKYIPTPKNGQVCDFYDRAGFRLTGEDNGTKEYEIETKSAKTASDAYKITFKQ